MRDAVDATGLEGGYRQGLLNAAGGVETAVDFLPVVGDVLGLEDASRAYGQGDMVGAGINMMGVVPVVGDVAAKGAKSALRGINAYHGSPYEFEQFSMDKIGAGSGVQAYGRGLYFAERPEVAELFREKKGEINDSLVSSVADFFNNDDSLSKARKNVKLAYPDASDRQVEKALNEFYMHLDDEGFIYNANLNVDPDELLDWNAPLSQQNEKVRQLAAERLNLPEASSRSKQAYIDEKMGMSGGEFYNRLVSDLGRDDAASSAFNDANIKGIRYSDGMSRSTGESTRNYVMFDDSLIDTKRVNDQLTPSWMNPEARMQRASDQGYLPETVYHGTAADITEFKPRQYGGSVTKANSAKMGTWFSDNPDVSAGYAKMAGEDMPVQVLIDASNKAERAGQWDKANELMGQAEKLEQSGVLIDGGGQNIIPARIRGNLFEIDAEGATMGDLDDSQLYKWSREAKKQGFDGLKIKNFSDNADYGTYTPANHYLIFDPKNIRSTNAEFDPTKADSADLLSSVGATSALRGIV
jgi:hypothetical protein